MNKRVLHTRFNDQRGVSMIELMIALLLGLFLMGGVLQLFASNKSTYSNMEGISQIQDNARAGLERMKDRVRMSGYMGCTNLGIQAPNNLTDDSGAGVVTNPLLFTAANQITGADNDGIGANPDIAAVINGTDTVTVISATLANTALNVNMTNSGNAVILAANPGNYQTDDVLLITDCENVDIFRATTVAVAVGTGITTISHALNDSGGSRVNEFTTLSKPYLVNNSMVMALRNVTYSVQATPRFDEAGNAILSLFETPAGGAAIEIMTGVQDLQITYGEDTGNDGEADVYVDAATVGNMINVVSIRLTLLISTDRNIGPDLRPYIDLNGNSVTGVNTDRRMRRAFTTTISLRNRSS